MDKEDVVHTQMEFCCCLVAKSCVTLCNPMHCSLPGSSVHGISQTRILEWVAISIWQADSLPLSHLGNPQ